MECGVWSVECEEWRVECEEWRVEFLVVFASQKLLFNKMLCEAKLQ